MRWIVRGLACALAYHVMPGLCVPQAVIPFAIVLLCDAFGKRVQLFIQVLQVLHCGTSGVVVVGG